MQLRSGKNTYQPSGFYMNKYAADGTQGIIRFEKCSSATTLQILRELSNKIKKNRKYCGMIHWHEDPSADLTKYINTPPYLKY